MNLSVQCAFAGVYAEFRENRYTMDTVSQLVELVRNYSRDMTNEAKRTMLQIPLCVLEKQSEVINEKDWASEMGSYFSGNAQYDAYAECFSQGAFTLATMKEYLEYILADDVRLNSDFKLRNIEYTIRHNVAPVEYSNFENSGPIFSRMMEKAFDL